MPSRPFSTSDGMRSDPGAITGYHAHVDPSRAGRTVEALVRMACYGPRCLLRHPDVIDQSPEILEVEEHLVPDVVVLIVAVAFEPRVRQPTVTGTLLT